MQGWERRLVEDVSRHPTAYRFLLGASAGLAVVAAVLVLGPSAVASATAPGDATRLAWGAPFVLFPLGYAAVVNRLLAAARSAA